MGLLTGMSCDSNLQQAQSSACTSCIVAISGFGQECKGCSLRRRGDGEEVLDIADTTSSCAKELDNPNRSFAYTPNSPPSDKLTIYWLQLTCPAYKPKN
jgi:hypothetical protein